jgi:hypothetical protein
MPHREPSADDLENSREARIARRSLVKQENYVNLLRQAQRLRSDNDQHSSPELVGLIADGEKRIADLSAKCAVPSWVVSQRRPQKSLSGETCKIFLDECGSHSLGA